MSRSFFSHASEDKDAVELVYEAVRDAMPEHAPWLDKYEIVGGQDLLTRISAGMDEAEKFFIFLSPVSVTKPWVQAELRRAIVRDIKDVDADYIVPVILGDVDPPAFLEHKRYVDPAPADQGGDARRVPCRDRRERRRAARRGPERSALDRRPTEDAQRRLRRVRGRRVRRAVLVRRRHIG